MNFLFKSKSLAISLLVLFSVWSNLTVAQCSNFVVDDFDDFEYTTVCPYIIPNTTYQTSPQASPSFGPSYSGNYHVYLNFQNGYVGPAFNRPYTVCPGATYRISFYHRDAWGGSNNTTFNVYDANGVLLVSDNVPWTGTTWNHWVSPELTATTNQLVLEIVNNQTTGNNDMVVDAMTLEVCQIQEAVVADMCGATTALDLFNLFSASMPNGGTWTGPSALTNGDLGTYDPAINVAGVYTYNVNQGGCADPQGTVTVTGSLPIDLGVDTHYCQVSSTILDAGSNFDFYLWSTGANTQTINVNTNGVYSVEAGILGANLIQHGDFQGGTTNTANNFTTSYTVGTGGPWGQLSTGGTYAINVNPNNTHTNFSSCGDHTSGSGNMLIANGSWTPNTVVWQQTVPVTQNTDYHFSFWAMNVVNNPNVSDLQLYVNGSPIGPVNQTTTACSWGQIADIWNSGTNTTAVLSIRNQSTAASGNDFAIDDIYFAQYCKSTDTIDVSFGQHILTVTPDQDICVGSSANLQANVTSSPGVNFNYIWDFTTSTAANQVVTPTTTTTYSVYAQGDDGCNSATQTSTVTVFNDPTPDAGIDQILCLGDQLQLNGVSSQVGSSVSWSHDVSGVSGTPAVNYSPNNNVNTPSLDLTNEGVYLFFFEESNGVCLPQEDTVEVLISNTDQLVNITDLTCFNNATGEIEIVNPDGVSFSFDDQATWGPSNMITGLAAGSYTVWSENQYGCKTSDLVQINEPAELLITVSNDTTICENGTSTLLATASESPTDFYWDFTSDLSAQQQVSPSVNGVYSVYAMNANGCISATETITVDLFDPLSGDISLPISICPGYPDNISIQNISGGVQPYNILWSSGESGTGTSMTISANPVSTQNYTVTVVDACESTPLVLQTEVEVLPLPEPLFTTPDSSICEPASFNLVNATDPAMTASVSWFISDGEFFIDAFDVTTEPLMAGTYDVQMIVISPQGCIDSATFINVLEVYDQPEADFHWSPNPVTMFNTNVSFQSTSYLGYEYQWYFQDAEPMNSVQENPQTSFPDGETGEYEVELIVTSEQGCVDTIIKVVTVIPEVTIFVPNTFTPDNDQFNQSWEYYIEGIDIYDFNIKVFNRWGEIVYESNDPSVKWDGTYQGQPVQDGTYTWYIEARELNSDERRQWFGHVNLMR